MTDPGEEFEEAVLSATGGGNRFFLSGGGGTGKTYRMNKIKHRLNNVISCAFTGDAALLVGGKTVSSLFGVPVGKRLDPSIRTAYAIKKARASDPSTKSFEGRWCKKTKEFKKSNRQMVLEAAGWIVFEEGPMIPPDYIDFVDAVMRAAKKKPHDPFGGVNVIVVGDRGQIPPVLTGKDRKQMLEFGYKEPMDGMCARVWEEWGYRKFHLTKIHRQKNPIDGNVLTRIRCGKFYDTDLQRVNRNITSTPPEGATVLCCENKDANRVNSECLKRVPGQLLKFESKLTGTLRAQRKAKEKRLGRKIDDSVYLKENCSVILAANGYSGPKADPLYYVNGDQGTFKGIDKHGRLIVYVDRLQDYVHIKVKKLDDIDYEATEELEPDEDGNLVPVPKLTEKKVGSYQQFPIRLGYAMSGHKSQGKTLEKVHIMLGTGDYRSPVLKTYGYMYVLLSRVTNLDNLTLDRPIERDDIRTSPALEDEWGEQQYEML